MRVEVIGKEGELAGHPEAALDALAKAAEADGADRRDWLEKAVAGAGATALSVPVHGEPAYEMVDELTAEAERAYAHVMTLMREAIRERLDEARRDALDRL